MEFWKNCWNCGHETLQERKALEFFPRIVEMFSKKDDGQVQQRIWAVYFDSFSFTKCKNVLLLHFLLMNIGRPRLRLKKVKVLLTKLQIQEPRSQEIL